MKEPKRLLSHGATDFERQLLRAVANERPSAVLRSRMQRGLGLVGPLAWASSVKAMVGSVASKVTGGMALSTVVAVGGIAIVSLTPGSNVLLSQTRPAVTETSSSATGLEPRVARASLPGAVEPARVGELAAEPSVSGTPVRSEQGSAPESGTLDARGAAAVPAALPEQDTAAALDNVTRDVARDIKHEAEADDAGRLREEIALLDAARSSLQHGERESARASLRTYRERFPDGILRREAGLLRRRAEAKRARATEH